MQALAVHRDAAVAVEFLSLGWGRLVRGPAVGSLFVLLAAVPPGAGGQAQSQWARDRPGDAVKCPCSGVWGSGEWQVPTSNPNHST